MHVLLKQNTTFMGKTHFYVFLGIDINPRRHRPFRILPRHKGGVGTTPLAVSPLIELELRGKKRACSSPRDEEIAI